MCTVTYLPGPGNSFILTSNRDEKELRRKAQPPRKFSLKGQSVFFPKDMEAGGTWIATGKNHFTLCLLNGGFQKHIPDPPYRVSRGLVLLDFFLYRDAAHFASEYDFNRIEPFTLVVLDTSAGLDLVELVWDGKRISATPKDKNLPHIWSSVTLYENEVIAQRRNWFDNWLKESYRFEMKEIMHFHEFGGTGDKMNDLLMNRNNEVLTVSITSIHKSEQGVCMKYKDMTEKKLYSIRII
ncbi:MAG: hypothetical protein FD123_3719 [Bacteroidetes bacterium]|nr:MAG: hypothetical protein FD123_3719 [Bacteroidota bacterium]